MLTNGLVENNVFKKRFSYQHLHGLMLVNFNRLACEMNIGHTEYRVMGILIGLWNKEKGRAYPTVEYLAEHCKMSKSTVIKALKKLVEINFIFIVKSQHKRQNYFINTNLLAPHVVPDDGTACNTAMYKQKRIKTKKNSSLKQKNDDESLKNMSKSNIQDKNDVLVDQLKQWQFCNPENAIQKYGKDKIKIAVEKTIELQPLNKGAYLRSLLTNEKFLASIEPDTKNNLLNALCKSKYWKHIKTGRLFKVRPDQGTHFYFTYNAEGETVHLFEENFTDFISAFEPAIKAEYEQKSQEVFIKPTKEQIVRQKMLVDVTEAKTLARLWKISV